MTATEGLNILNEIFLCSVSMGEHLNSAIVAMSRIIRRDDRAFIPRAGIELKITIFAFLKNILVLSRRSIDIGSIL
jgi:hypothetical protein